MQDVVSEGWNHNTHYHEYLLRSVPRPCPRALDVGCGLGGFARRLACVSEQVDAIDRQPAVLARARELSSGYRNVRFAEADFLAWPVGESYDFVSLIATLHHMPFADALQQGARALRPGGVLAVLGLHRAASFTARVAQAVVGLPVSRYHRLTHAVSPVGEPAPPLLDPGMTLGAIRRAAALVLPGASIRRHLLWRYSLVWVKRSAKDDLR